MCRRASVGVWYLMRGAAFLEANNCYYTNTEGKRSAINSSSSSFKRLAAVDKPKSAERRTNVLCAMHQSQRSARAAGSVCWGFDRHCSHKQAVASRTEKLFDFLFVPRTDDVRL